VQEHNVKRVSAKEKGVVAEQRRISGIVEEREVRMADAGGEVKRSE